MVFFLKKKVGKFVYCSLKINDLCQTVLLNFCHRVNNVCVPCRQPAHYDAMDNDIVQGAEDQGIQEEEGGGETS